MLLEPHRFQLLSVRQNRSLWGAPMEPWTTVCLRQIHAAEEQRQLLTRELDRWTWRRRPSKCPGFKSFGTEPPARVVQGQYLDSVPPRVGEDEQVPRKRIEAERVADDAGQGIERLPKGGGTGCEVHPGVGQEAQHWGNWAKSSPTQPKSAPRGTRSFQPFGATISGQSDGAATAGGRGERLGRTSTATN